MKPNVNQVHTMHIVPTGTHGDLNATKLLSVPATAEALDALLSDLGDISTAVEWQRAALVFARLSSGLTLTGFTKLGIRGLKSVSAVRKHRDAWQKAIDAGIALPAVLGAEIVLPDAEWDDYIDDPDVTNPTRVGGPEMADAYKAAAEEMDTTIGMAIRAGQSRNGAAAAILADEAFAEAMRDAIRERDRRHKPIVDSDPEPPDEFTNVLLAMSGAKRRLIDVLGAVVNFVGVQSLEQRQIVADLAGEMRLVVEAIEGAARGDSLDEGLERLLADGGAL
jgi:hypothetical protein